MTIVGELTAESDRACRMLAESVWKQTKSSNHAQRVKIKLDAGLVLKFTVGERRQHRQLPIPKGTEVTVYLWGTRPPSGQLRGEQAYRCTFHLPQRSDVTVLRNGKLNLPQGLRTGGEGLEATLAELLGL